MARRITREKYKLRVTVKDLQDKKYRKYLYPQEIDGITFYDDVERKLSKSSWFSCIEPKQQLLIEKELRERALGEFNHKFYHYEDDTSEAALGISKSVLLRLTESLAPIELQFLMQIAPYIHINDGILRNKDRQIFTIDEIGVITQTSPSRAMTILSTLDDKRIVFFARKGIKPETDNDIFLSLLQHYTEQEKKALYYASDILIYVNPYIFFFGQYIDKYVMPYFNNSAWYVINPYASKIEDWINTNCK